MRRNFFGYLFVIALFFLLISDKFLTEGMFMDGLYYATISRNLSEGLGTFWQPQFTVTNNVEFYGHPPLALGLESLFFHFGNTLFVAKLYSLFTYFIVAFMMFFIWREIGGERRHFPFVLFIYVMIPIVSWGSVNNLLENTMAVFVVSSVLFYLMSLREKRFMFLVLSGFSLFLTVLTKGFTGLYPLAMPVVWSLFARKIPIKRAAVDTIVLVTSLLLPLAFLLLLNPKAFHYATTYYQLQVVESIKQRQVVDSRFFIVWKFITQMIIPVVIVVLLHLAIHIKSKKSFWGSVDWNTAVALLVLSLCGVLPMMLSLKQRDFYILTVYPFAALSLALVLQPVLLNWKMKPNFKLYFNVVSLFLISLAVTFNSFNYKQIKRDKDIITDLQKILPEIPEHSIISVSEKMQREYSTIAYCYFYRHVSFTDKEVHDYYLCHKGDLPEAGRFDDSKLELKKFSFFKKR